MSTLRGLDIQLAYSREKLAMQIYGTDGVSGMTRAITQAQRLGLQECTITQRVPATFVSEELRQAWHAGNTQVITNLAQWDQACSTLEEEAYADSRGGGYEWFQMIFSDKVNRALTWRVPAPLHEGAIQLAREKGYISEQDRLTLIQEMADDDYCCHGLPIEACPAGCGEGY